jgi:phosphoglycolate phosphatase-like HAD superfamily hydrolase
MRDRARVHARCFSLACEAVLGHPLSLEAVHVSGSTDPRILRDAFAAAGIPEARWRPRSREILDALCQAVARQADHMQLHLMPGVLPVLDHLASRGRCLGVATGNLERIGWLKLERTGLRRYFAFGGFSDAYEERADMIAAAAEAAREAAGRQASLVVVGDTPADICAAHANRIPVLAVATGHFTFDQLLGSSPEICAETLAALRETAR